MNILLLYPEFPDTFWSFKYALSFVGKKAAFPPLGLLTIAGLLPQHWGKRVVDLNVSKLARKDLLWADYAFISGMTVQRESARKVITRCRNEGLKVVGGGPLFTMEHDSFMDVDHLILNEAEITLPMFLEDLAENRVKHSYSTDDFADMKDTPRPQWDLINMRPYHSMAIQFSRGCPYNCDFCNITSLFGRRFRTKNTEQIIDELDALYTANWRGNIFFVDDNFIGNKHKLKSDLLPDLITWRKSKKHITFQTEVSIDLADDEELMNLMYEAGFDTVFVGIETTNESSLVECNKRQNAHRDLCHDVKRIQRAGLQVQGGFIIGFDSDNSSIFQEQIEFIQRSGIVTAMVGLLQAPLGTRLYKRMKEQGRILDAGTGDNVEGTTNIIPAMKLERLRQGYRDMLYDIYDPSHYYERIRVFMSEYRTPKVLHGFRVCDVKAAFLSVFRLGFIGRERLHYWRLLFWTIFQRPDLLPLAVTLAINGYHFRKVCKLHVR